ncbi:MAG: cupin domain-containing protein [Gammaproteobacteria bacterium]|nr:cupin domain-containing protein [Gammaproteobacteria bacterium]
MSRHDDDPIPDQIMDPAVLAALYDGLTPVPPPPSLRARILERIGERSGEHGGEHIHATPAGDALVTIRGGGAGWRTLIPGIDYKMLAYDEQGGTKSFLLRAQAGMRMPPHGHHGFEECLVLDGEFSFGDLTLRAGDFHAATTTTEHVEAYTATGVTVYLRASILDYPGIAP